MNELPQCNVEYRYAFADSQTARRTKRLEGRALEVFIVNSHKEGRIILAINVT